MERIGPKPPKSKSPAIGRVLRLFLTFTYLFVGLVHATAHASEGLPATIPTGISLAVTNGSDGHNPSSESSAVAEHCHVYATVLIAVPVPVAVCSVQSVQLSFVTSRPMVEAAPRLDTPPPKHLT